MSFDYAVSKDLKTPGFQNFLSNVARVIRVNLTMLLLGRTDVYDHDHHQPESHQHNIDLTNLQIPIA